MKIGLLILPKDIQLISVDVHTLLHISRGKTGDILGIRMLILASVHIKGAPFSKAPAEKLTGFLSLLLPRRLAHNRAVMTGHLAGRILGNAKNHKPPIPPKPPKPPEPPKPPGN